MPYQNYDYIYFSFIYFVKGLSMVIVTARIFLLLEFFGNIFSVHSAAIVSHIPKIK